jgi:hypothetical protein
MGYVHTATDVQDAIEADRRGRQAPLTPTGIVLHEIEQERAAQNTKWGEQNHPDGTGGACRCRAADEQRRWTNMQAAEKTLTWTDVLEEEVAEALAETDPAKLRAELIQIAAVAAAWAEAIDRRLAAQVRGEVSA